MTLMQTKLGSIAQHLRDHGYETWVVGGAVRDFLTNNNPKDFDLATDAEPTTVIELFDGYNDKWFLYYTNPIGFEFGTVQIVVSDPKSKHTFEITTLRKDITAGRKPQIAFSDNILEDLARRDFTINAMAIPVMSLLASKEEKLKNIIDPFDGQKDLKNRTIRAVGDPEVRFKEDALRIVRACRFAGYSNGFVIEPKTWIALKNLSNTVTTLSKERISNEVMKIMTVNKPGKCINIMKHAGILSFIIPPLDGCIGIKQNQSHNEPVYEHCIESCNAAPKDNPKLRLAALLHDVGKPLTVSVDDKTKDYHFYNHEVEGALLAYEYLMEYKFGLGIAQYVSLMIRHHMFRFTTKTKRSTIKKWMNKLKGYHDDVIKLRLADRAGNLAKRGKPLITRAMKRLLLEIEEIENTEDPMTIADLAISGKTLIDMGHKPGPQFGIVLRALLERVLDEPELNNEKTLRRLATNLFDSSCTNYYT